MGQELQSIRDGTGQDQGGEGLGGKEDDDGLLQAQLKTGAVCAQRVPNTSQQATGDTNRIASSGNLSFLDRIFS